MTSITAGAANVMWMPRMMSPVAAACLTAFFAIMCAPLLLIVEWGWRLSCRCRAGALHELRHEEIGVLVDHRRAGDAERFDVGREVHLHPLRLQEFVRFRLVLHRVRAQEFVGVATRRIERLLFV